MRDDDGDRMPETEAEWAEAEAARRKRADWSDAMAEDRQRSQAAWVAKWTAAHTWEPNPRGGMIARPKPGWVWPNRGSRKDAMRAADAARAQ
jgi:hypothetical protein